MVNLEPLKNLNELLTQVIDFAEKDPSVKKMLELANYVAKQRRSSMNERSSMSVYKSTQAESSEAEEVQPVRSSWPVNSLDKIQTMNSTVKSLGDLVELVNNLAKQMAKFGPVLTTLMKNQPFTVPSRKSSHDKSNFTGIKSLDEKALTNALLTILVPILLLSLTKNQPMAFSV